MRNWTAVCLMHSMPERGVAVPLSFVLTLLSRDIHMIAKPWLPDDIREQRKAA